MQDLVGPLDIGGKSAESFVQRGKKLRDGQGLMFENDAAGAVGACSGEVTVVLLEHVASGACVNANGMDMGTRTEQAVPLAFDMNEAGERLLQPDRQRLNKGGLIRARATHEGGVQVEAVDLVVAHDRAALRLGGVGSLRWVLTHFGAELGQLVIDFRGVVEFFDLVFASASVI